MRPNYDPGSEGVRARTRRADHLAVVVDPEGDCRSERANTDDSVIVVLVIVILSSLRRMNAPLADTA